MGKPVLTKDAKKADDIGAHKTRINVYAKHATSDINTILENELSSFLNRKNLTILDVGCGNGKQSLYLAQKFPSAQILSLDVSDDAILELKKEKTSRISAQIVDFNNISALRSQIIEFSGKFDIIISFYAIYYANNMENLIEELISFLGPKGKLILVGYSHYNNTELLNITRKYSSEKLATSDFIEPGILAKLFYHYIYRTYYFNNPINFPDVKTFSDYYVNYGLYSKEIETQVLLDVEEQILTHGSFKLSKVAQVVSVDGAGLNSLIDCLPGDLQNDSFSPDLYRSLLDKITASGYRIIPVGNIHKEVESTSGKVLILRHDVDLSPKYALEMATEESNRGISATYFFLISGGFYNILDHECRSALNQIRDLGHEIGLHFEYPERIKEDREILSVLVGQPINSISQHNPTICQSYNSPFSDMVNAYDPRITKEYGFVYVSDSGMKWRRTAFECLESQKLYLLTHPEIWYSKSQNVIQLHRSIEQHEVNKLRKKYNEYVVGNVEYLRKRNTP